MNYSDIHVYIAYWIYKKHGENFIQKIKMNTDDLIPTSRKPITILLYQAVYFILFFAAIIFPNFFTSIWKSLGITLYVLFPFVLLDLLLNFILLVHECYITNKYICLCFKNSRLNSEFNIHLINFYVKTISNLVWISG